LKEPGLFTRDATLFVRDVDIVARRYGCALITLDDDPQGARAVVTLLTSCGRARTDGSASVRRRGVDAAAGALVHAAVFDDDQEAAQEVTEYTVTF